MHTILLLSPEYMYSLCVTHLECILLVKVHHLEDESGDDVEALAVADGLVVPGVGQEYCLQDGMFLLRGEPCVASPVEVLLRGRGGEGRGGEGTETLLSSKSIAQMAMKKSYKKCRYVCYLHFAM